MVVAAIAVLAVPGFAARIFINSTAITATSNNGVAFSTRIKASSGWDVMLGRFEDTAVASNYLNGDLGVISQNLSFTLEHRAGQGYVFTVINPLATGAVTRVLGWGTFNPAVAASAQAAMLNGNAPGLAVNAIRLQTRASVGNASIVLSSLNFSITSPGAHSTAGSFQSTTTINSTTGPSWANLGPGFADATGYQSQWILVDQNMTALSWVLQGAVQMISPTQRNENLRLNVTGYSLAANFPAPPQETPEPAAYATMGAGLAGLVAIARLRRKA